MRHTHADTSREAFRLIQPDIGRRQKQVIDFIMQYSQPHRPDFTAKEIARALRMDRDSISPRLSELGKKGLITCEPRICTVSGYRVKAWRLAPEIWLS